MWKMLHKGRITSSLFGSVLSSGPNPQSLVHQIIHGSSLDRHVYNRDLLFYENVLWKCYRYSILTLVQSLLNKEFYIMKVPGTSFASQVGSWAWEGCSEWLFGPPECHHQYKSGGFRSHFVPIYGIFGSDKWWMGVWWVHAWGKFQRGFGDKMPIFHQ